MHKAGQHVAGTSSPEAVQRWNEILDSLYDAAELINAPQSVVRVLERPQRILEAAVPLRDSGSLYRLACPSQHGKRSS